jgi:hypothetical protein
VLRRGLEHHLGRGSVATRYGSPELHARVARRIRRCAARVPTPLVRGFEIGLQLHVPSPARYRARLRDWYPEDADEIAATKEFITVVRRLVQGGAKVDCIDAWSGESGTAGFGEPLTVDLAAVADADFRFFENRQFTFVVSA